jgi:hypothetical protein
LRNRKPAYALDLDNPEVHFTLIFEGDTEIWLKWLG